MKLLIRTDGGRRIGTGHVMRCLVLAQGCKRFDDEAAFALAESTPSLDERLRTAAIPFEKISSAVGSAGDVEQTIQLAREHNADWVVADGYSFGSDYQRQIKAVGLRLMLVDDYGHAEHYLADLVLNQNLSANPRLYSKREAATRLLLGTRYALLHQEFLTYKNWKRETPGIARKVLVTLGGADPDNVTSKVIGALSKLRDIEVVVVAGGSNPHLATLQILVSRSQRAMRVVVDVKNMPELMAWADVAIAAGGTTLWELAFMGLPALTFVLADNQRAVAEGLASAQVARKTNLDSLVADLHSLMSDAAVREAMGERARQLVDGLGTSRVLTHLRAAKLQLRPVRTEDCRQIWEWANDPEVRSVSPAQEEIPWADHLKWFSGRVNSPASLFYVAANSSEKPIGQIRFNVNGDEAILSVSLAREARGHGYGSALIAHGAQRCFADSRVNLIRAFVKPTNVRSIRAFEKTDFVPAEPVELRGQPMRQFILKRDVMS